MGVNLNSISECEFRDFRPFSMIAENHWAYTVSTVHCVPDSDRPSGAVGGRSVVRCSDPLSLTGCTCVCVLEEHSAAGLFTS